MKIAILIIKFFFVGALFIVSNYALELSDPAQFDEFTELYSNWLHNIFDNTLSVTSYVVQFDWLPNPNQTILSP